MKKRRISSVTKTRMTKFMAKAGRLFIKSQLLTFFLVLCALGFWVGLRARPEQGGVPFQDLFEGMTVLSFREDPSDTTARFVVELAAGGHVYRQYDLDAHRFIEPMRGRDYSRSIGGSRYRPLTLRGHVDRGFWLELPDSTRPKLGADQFSELYNKSLDYVKPVGIVSTVLGTLSGYSVGFHLATWGSSLSNPAVQKRVLEMPGMDRVIAHEAWRRVLLEPVLMGDESDAGRFAAMHGTQRLYTNFFRLALNDSDGFIPREGVRLDSLGHRREARAMRAFATAVRRAAQDTIDLRSSDFSAIEEWASLLDHRGHWSAGATPPPGEERIRYLGTLAWYGVAPTQPGEQRIWVGPRVLVREGDTEGFVADEIPLTTVGCPVPWRPWLTGGGVGSGGNAWTAQWMGGSREFAPIVEMGIGITRQLRGQR